MLSRTGTHDATATTILAYITTATTNRDHFHKLGLHNGPAEGRREVSAATAYASLDNPQPWRRSRGRRCRGREVGQQSTVAS